MIPPAAVHGSVQTQASRGGWQGSGALHCPAPASAHSQLSRDLPGTMAPFPCFSLELDLSSVLIGLMSLYF